MTAPALIELDGVSRDFVAGGSMLARLFRPAQSFRAVDRLSLSIAEGEVVGLVGESGSGKTTVAQLVLRLLPASAGAIRYRGVDITRAKGTALLPFRRQAQMIFQDSQSALNPRKTIRRTLVETLRRRHGAAADLDQRAAALLAATGLGPEILPRYPHALSGGQRQRVGIARALAMEPEFIVADEPVSALDISLQAQIINLMVSLRAERRLTMLFISHDLALVNHLCDRVAVMYAGGIVESGTPSEVLGAPRHPYTQALIAAIPRGVAGRGRTVPLRAVRSEAVPAGCAFAPRCPNRFDVCEIRPPALLAITPTHAAACHLVLSG